MGNLARSWFHGHRILACILLLVFLPACQLASTPTPEEIFPIFPTIAVPTTPARPQATATRIVLNLATPTLVPSLTPIGRSSQTPAGAPFATPLPNASRPDCKRQEEAWTCIDETLGLAFTYPARWGRITAASLLSGSCGGFSYSYSFDDFASAPANGGLSMDYCESRGGDITSFSGFRTGSLADWRAVDGCSLFPNSAECSEISSDVILAVLLPQADEVCDPGPGTVFQPLVIVALNLVLERPVHGFLFAQHFLSVKTQDWLFAPLGGIVVQPALCAERSARREFDGRVQSLAQQIKDSSTDEETQYLLGMVEAFAQSVKVILP